MDGTARLVCDTMVTADAELHIRHGNTIPLQKFNYLVSQKPAQHVLTGYPLLESLGLDTRKV